MNFAVINDTKYKSSLILLGSNFLQGLHCICNFTKNKIFIKGKYMVDLYTDDSSAFAQMEKIKNARIQRNGVIVVTTKDLTLSAGQTMHLDINLSASQAAILMGRDVLGRSSQLNHVLISNIFIEQGYNFYTEPVTLTIKNMESRKLIIPRGKRIYSLFPIMECRRQSTVGRGKDDLHCNSIFALTSTDADDDDKERG